MRTPVKIGLIVMGATAVFTILTSRIECPIEPARHLAVLDDLRDLTKGAETYKQAQGYYPATLQTMIEEQHWKRLPADPWRHEYVYRIPGIKNQNGIDLFSAGPDGVPNTADDDWGN